MIETIILQITQQLPEQATELTQYDWSSWEGVKNFLLDQLANNQLVQGGIILGALTTIGYYLKDIPIRLWKRIERKLTYEVTVENRDYQFYLAFEDWLRDNHFKSYRNVRATFAEPFMDNIQYEIDSLEEDEGNVEVPTASSNKDFDEPFIENKKRQVYNEINPVEYRQVSDWFFIYYKWWPIKIEKNREKLENASNYETMFYDSYTISSIFGKKLIDKLLKEVAEKYRQKKLEKVGGKEISVYINQGGNWSKLRDFEPKPIKSIVLDEKQQIIEDLKNFRYRKQWYKERAIPYKRGHLYEGPPGNGKTSLSLSLANYFNCDCYILNLNEVNDFDLKVLFQNLKKNSMLLIEDVDAMTSSKDRDKNESNSDLDAVQGKINVSLTTLLNCLDGVLYKEGIITVMTTNHYEKLDSALTRDGRVDRIVHVPNPKKHNVKEYLSIYYEVDQNSIKIDNYNESLSMAKIQNICLGSDSCDEAIDKILTEDKQNINNNKS